MKITMILTNGAVYTLDGKKYEAIAIAGNRIAALGTTAEIEEIGRDAVNRIDLKGKCVCPGFNDSHLHLVEFGLCAQMINLEESDSIEAVITEGRRFIAEREKKKAAEIKKEDEQGKEAWVLGFGWNEKQF